MRVFFFALATTSIDSEAKDGNASTALLGALDGVVEGRLHRPTEPNPDLDAGGAEQLSWLNGVLCGADLSNGLRVSQSE